MSRPLVDQYQGSPILCLNPESRYRFQFGVAKAKMILEHLEALKAFVASNGATCAPDTIDNARVSLDDLLNGKVP